jgi:hypothetical protein
VVRSRYDRIARQDGSRVGGRGGAPRRCCPSGAVAWLLGWAHAGSARSPASPCRIPRLVPARDRAAWRAATPATAASAKSHPETRAQRSELRPGHSPGRPAHLRHRSRTHGWSTSVRELRQGARSRTPAHRAVR